MSRFLRAAVGVCVSLSVVVPLAAAQGSTTPRTLLYASVWGDNYVSVADGTSMRELRQIPALADGPAVLEATPDQKKIYLENGGPDARTVGVIDAGAMTQDRQIQMSGVQGDRATAIPTNGRYYYYSSIPDGNITQVDTRTDTVSHIYSRAGNDFTVSRDGKTLFAYGSTSVTAIDVATGATIGTLSLPTSTNVPLVQGGFGWTMASPDGTQLIHVANPTVFVDIRNPRTMKLITTVPVGSDPVLAGISPDGHYIWVPNAGDGTISVLDVRAHKVIRTLTTGRYMTYSAFDPSGKVVYVAQARSSTPPPTPATLLALYFAQMGGSGLITSRSGQYYSRPGLDTPGEVVAYDARTFKPLARPPLLTATVAAYLLAINPR